MTERVRARPRPLPRHAGAKAVLVDCSDFGFPFDIVDAKIRVPEQCAGAVSRTALVNRLRADTSARAVSIIAPAGFGKTTLLGQWAARDERPFAWVSLDRRDIDPVVLLRHLAAAMDEINPVDQRVIDALASTGESVWVRVVPRVAALVAASEPFVLVVDDAHTLSEGDSAEVLSMLAEHIPDGSALVVSSRAESTPLTGLRVKGNLIELGTNDLAMTRREAEALLRNAGVELTEEDCTALIDKTEGWAAALYLAALSIRKSPSDRKGAGPMFTGDDRYVADYFHAEYLSGVTPERLTFLRRTSVLEKMCGALCDATLDRTRSSDELEAIRSANLFLVPLDANGTWYRYHHLFRELLRRELIETEPALVPTLGRRASHWFERNGDSDSALEHALAVGETDGAARILAEIAVPAYASGRRAKVTTWLEQFKPDPLLHAHPGVAVQGAQVFALAGATDDATRWLAAAEAGAAEDPSLAPQIALVRALMCRDGVDAMLADAEAASRALHDDSPTRPLALLGEAAAHMMLGDNTRADEILERAIASARVLGLTETEVLATSERMLISEEVHDHGRADEQEREMFDLLAGGAFDTSAPCAIEFAASARSHLRRGDWEGARVLLERACLLTPRLTDAIPWLSVQVRLELAQTFVALRDVASARALLHEIDAILSRRPKLGALLTQAESLRESLAAVPVQDGKASGLTPAELRLLPFLTTHLSFREIGERLFLSRNTIKTQAISVYRKLHVSTRSDAIERAVQLGLVEGVNLGLADEPIHHVEALTHSA